MLKISIDGNRSVIEADGELIDTLKDLGLCICAIYGAVVRANPDAGLAFKRAVTAMTSDTGPVWDIDGMKPDFARTVVIDKDELKKQMEDDE